MTEIPTDEGKLYLATVLDLFSRKLLASPTAEHPDAELAGDAIKMAAAVRGGRTVIDGVIFHTDRGSTYTAKDFTKLCRRLGVVQSMGRVGSCFDNAASEAFFSTLEHEVLSRHHFRTRAEARAVVVPVRSAISVLATPSAANNTIRARVANPADTVDARVNASSRPRSPSRNSKAAATYTDRLSQPTRRKCINDTRH